MPPVEFSPRQPQPFTLDQAMLLEPEMLVAEIARLENSLHHLRETQAELEAFIREDPEGDADGELGRAVRENEGVIASQTERISLIKVALMNKVGDGGMRHYGLAERQDAGRSDTARQDRPDGGRGSPHQPRDRALTLRRETSATEPDDTNREQNAADVGVYL